MSTKTVKKPKDKYGRGSGVANPIDVHVGARLKQRRTLLGLSQESLADAAGVTFQQIQKYERGANRISASRLFQFSKVLQVSTAYFFEKLSDNKDIGLSQPSQNYGFSDAPQQLLENEDVMESKETLELIRTYYSVQNEQQRKDLLNIVKTMAHNFSSK